MFLHPPFPCKFVSLRASLSESFSWYPVSSPGLEPFSCASSVAVAQHVIRFLVPSPLRHNREFARHFHLGSGSSHIARSRCRAAENPSLETHMLSVCMPCSSLNHTGSSAGLGPLRHPKPGMGPFLAPFFFWSEWAPFGRSGGSKFRRGILISSLFLGVGLLFLW